MSEFAPKQVFESVFDAMIQAGWLVQWRFTTAKGYHLTWHPQGKQLAHSLKQIILSHGLLADDRGPATFTRLAQGLALGDTRTAFEADPLLLAFWARSAGDLHLETDEELLALAHVVHGWG